MFNTLSDQSVSNAIQRRMKEELVELDSALTDGCSASILDEIVDVKYYIDKLAAHYNIGADCLTRYAAVKSALRDSGVRCKNLELRLATEFVAESNHRIDWRKNES